MTDKTPIQTFAQEIWDFLNKHEMAPSTFGRAAVNSPSFVQRVSWGKPVTTATMEKVKKFMQEYKNG